MWTPTSSAAAAELSTAELILEEHYSEQGFEIDLVVTRATDGTILSEATLVDPSNTDELDIWTDGTTVWWDGQMDGEHVNGSMLTVDIVHPDFAEAGFCLHPIGAIVCIGAAVVFFGGCAGGLRCPADEPTNPPDSSGHGEGGGGDSDGESGDDDGGGGDE